MLVKPLAKGVIHMAFIILIESLFKEWNWDKNNNLNPNKLNVKAKTVLWWKCKKGHEWPARLDHRKRGSGCPYCSGKALLPCNSLQSTYPSIAKEWHPSKNKVNPWNVSKATTKIFWWLCKKGHEWEASVSNRTRRKDKCPYCSGKYATEETCLQNKYPNIAKQWEFKNNGLLTPQQVTPMSNKKVWWICQKGHTWEDKVCARVKGNRCKICFPRIPQKVVSPEYNLKVIHPYLMIEWHPNKNEGIDPSLVSPGSGKKMWWKCKECDHEWKASIDNRKKGQGCQKCNYGYATSFKEQFLFFYISKIFLDSINRYKICTKNNGNLEIDIFIPSLNLAIEYDGYFYHKNRKKQDEEKNFELQQLGIKLFRIRENNGPNKQLPKIKKYGSVEMQVNAEKDAELIEVIKYLFENLIGDLDKSLLGKMGININRDCMAIYSLAKKNEKERSLAFLYPDIAKEWHKEKNGEYTAWNVSPGSIKRVWWKCNSCTKEWEATIYKRIRGQNCQYCKGNKAGPVRSLLTERPNVAAMWHSKKNGLLTPEDVLPGSNAEAWWFCSKCNQEWKEPIHRRSSKKGCPFCNGKRVYKGNCLATFKPKIAELWHPTKNKNLTSSEVTSSSGKLVWWLCKCGKEFEKPIYRMRVNSCKCIKIKDF